MAIDFSGNNLHLSLGPDAGIVAGGKFGNALDPDRMADQDGMGTYRYKAETSLNPWLEGVYPSAFEGSTSYVTARDVNRVLSADKWDGFKDFYSCFPAQHPRAEDVHILYLKTLRHFHPSRQPWFPGFADLNSPMQTVIALSRDGENWNHYDRKEICSARALRRG